MKEKQKNIEPRKSWTNIFCIIMFLVFPVYYQNNYINILEAKTIYFQVTTGIYCAGMLFLLLLPFLKGQKKPIKIKIDAEFIFSGMLIAGILIPLLFSDKKQSILWGTEGKLFGAVTLLLCIGVYICVSRGFQWSSTLLWAMVLGVGFVFALAILNRYGMDPLGMYENLIETQIDEFLSTIGQINVVSNFVCVFLPFLMGLFLYSKEMVSKMMYGMCVWFGVMAGVCTNSDSFFVGIAVGMLYYLWFAMESKEGMSNYLILSIICTFSMISLKLLNQAVPYETVWRESQRWIVEDVPWLIIAVVIIVVSVILYKGPKEISLIWLRNLIYEILVAAVILGAIYVIYINSKDYQGTNSMFVISDSWGTNRGYVWKRTLELYEDLPIFQKLFGVGLGGFKEFFLPFYDESIQRFGYYFVDAHNEFLQFIVTIGLVGVIGYFGMIITAIVNCLKEKSEMQIAIAAVFFVWIGQSMFNNPLVFTTPYLFLFMGISKAVREKK